MRLRVRRLGGIAGVTLQTHVDTAELPSDSASKVDHALQELEWGTETGPPHPDAFRYEITQLDHPHQRSVLLDEHEVPPELHGLIEAVGDAGEIARQHEDPGPRKPA